MRKFLLLFLLILPLGVFGQFTQPRPRLVSVLPSLPCSPADFVELIANPNTAYLCQAGVWNAVVTGTGGGITNSAPNNVVTKSDGTNLIASSITDNGTTIATAEPFSAASFSVTGASGAGFLHLPSNSAPTTPTGAVRLYGSPLANRFSILGASGFAGTLNFNSLTAARTFTFPDVSDTFAMLGTAQSFTSAQTIAINGIGAVSTDGLLLSNTTAAAAGAQQFSPRLHFIGQGWKTTATAGSQSTDWIVENQPVQGAANPNTFLVFSSSINGGSYAGTVGFQPNLGGASAYPILRSGVGGGLEIGRNDNLPNINAEIGVISGANSGASTVNTGIYAWSDSPTTLTTLQTIISSPSAATVHLGKADAATSPTPQTFGVQSAAGVSNTAGGLWKFTDSAGTGTGVSGGFEWDVHPAGTTGTSQNAAVSALAIDSTKLATFGGDYRTTNFTNAGSTGSVTINSRVGSVQLAAAGTSLTVTNSTVSATSIIVCSMMTADTTAKSAVCVPGSGSFVVTASAAATGTTTIAFHVLN